MFHPEQLTAALTQRL